MFDESNIVGRWRANLAIIHAEGSQNSSIVRWDRARPGGTQSGRSCKFPEVHPKRIGKNVRNKDRLAPINGCATGRRSVRMPGRQSPHDKARGAYRRCTSSASRRKIDYSIPGHCVSIRRVTLVSTSGKGALIRIILRASRTAWPESAGEAVDGASFRVPVCATGWIRLLPAVSHRSGAIIDISG
jgi:hypothetical protein